MTPAELAADAELAVAAARAAGEAILHWFRHSPEVHFKAPDQPVTDADLRADAILAERLRDARPDYAWLSEETADSPGRLPRERVWIVDPLDGTRSFLDDRAEFAVSVGLAESGTAVLGVVFNPATGELFHAIHGGGAYRNGIRLQVSTRGPDAAELRLVASHSEVARGEFEGIGAPWQLHQVGSTACKMMRVAEGAADGFLSRGPKSEWDVCASALIVEEAGGRVSDVDGQPFRFNEPVPLLRGVIAANPRLHNELVGLVPSLPTASRLPGREEV